MAGIFLLIGKFILAKPNICSYNDFEVINMQYQNLSVKFDNQTKILKYDPLLIYVRVKTLDGTNTTINCLNVQHALTLLYQLKPDVRLALYGHYNQRHQFVITRFMVGQPVQQQVS